MQWLRLPTSICSRVDHSHAAPNLLLVTCSVADCGGWRLLCRGDEGCARLNISRLSSASETHRSRLVISVEEAGESGLFGRGSLKTETSSTSCDNVRTDTGLDMPARTKSVVKMCTHHQELMTSLVNLDN